LTRILLIITACLVFLLFPGHAWAVSSYVLPYPSAMPGSVFYKLNLIQEELLKYWYFGDFGQYKYNLQQSDKYLVEAKTLFEYKQYFLGVNALNKSNKFFSEIFPTLIQAKANNKNIAEKQQEYDDARSKHIEVLRKMRNDVPEKFEWKPEKQKVTVLDLAIIIDYSIDIRNKDE